MLKNKKGISLIALIVTIIVIIILAAIVISIASNAIENARFARFTSEFAEFRTAIGDARLKIIREQGTVITTDVLRDAQIYYMIAKKLDEVPAEPTPVGDIKVSEMEYRTWPNLLDGEECSELPDDPLP